MTPRTFNLLLDLSLALCLLLWAWTIYLGYWNQ